jgi:hypothetical protein
VTVYECENLNHHPRRPGRAPRFQRITSQAPPHRLLTVTAVPAQVLGGRPIPEKVSYIPSR